MILVARRTCGILFCLLCLLHCPSHANGPEEQLISSVLKQVRAICAKAETLDRLGRETVLQSAILLDAGTAAEPALLKILREEKKENWKFRYWAADMLGYLGTRRSFAALLSVTNNEKGPEPLRLRALDSIVEIGKRNTKGRARLRKDLQKTAGKVKNKKVKNKVHEILLKIRSEDPER